MVARDYRYESAQRAVAERDEDRLPAGKHTLAERGDGPVAVAAPSSQRYASPGDMWTQAAAGVQQQRAAVAASPAPQTGATATAAPGAVNAANNSDDRRMAEAIISGYQAAQHELDTTGSPDATLDHLRHVANVSPEFSRNVDFERVWTAADSFERSLRGRARRSPAKYQALVDINQGIRHQLGLTGASKPHEEASGTGASYAKAAIVPALDVLAIHVRDAMTTLDHTQSYDQATRTSVVDRVAGEIRFSSEYIAGLVAVVPAHERHEFAAAASAAALSAGRMLRWVRTRPAHEQLEAKLMRGISALDAVLIATGVETIGQRDEAPLTENQRHGAEEEQSEFDRAMAEAANAVESISRLQMSKIELFEKLAGLDDHRVPDFKTALLNAIIDTTVTTMLGQFARLLAAAPPAAALPLAAKAVSLPAPPKDPAAIVGIDNVFSVGFGSLKSAVSAKLASAPSSGVDTRKRALHYYCYGLRVAEDARWKGYADNLAALKQRSAITADQLREIKQSALSQRDTIVQHQLQEITKGWAQYLSRSRLGSKTIGHDKVSNMRDYFGEQKPGGRAFGTSMAGGDGILSVTMLIEHGRPAIDPSATKVIGLNSELQSHMLSAANHELDRVELPKEVHVQARFARATLALDEKNQLRDVRNWNDVQIYAGGMSAASFWHTWGHNLKVG